MFQRSYTVNKENICVWNVCLNIILKANIKPLERSRDDKAKNNGFCLRHRFSYKHTHSAFTVNTTSHKKSLRLQSANTTQPLMQCHDHKNYSITGVNCRAFWVMTELLLEIKTYLIHLKCISFDLEVLAFSLLYKNHWSGGRLVGWTEFTVIDISGKNRNSTKTKMHFCTMTFLWYQ